MATSTSSWVSSSAKGLLSAIFFVEKGFPAHLVTHLLAIVGLSRVMPKEKPRPLLRLANQNVGNLII